jgi:hypothetical protein
MKSSCIDNVDFIEALVDAVPMFDKAILADFRPSDGWIGHVETGPIETELVMIPAKFLWTINKGRIDLQFHPMRLCVRSVRRKPIYPMGNPVDITWNRFRSVFPNSTSQWKRMPSRARKSKSPKALFPFQPAV